ncbi:hypothetical protein DUZ99_17720 [Xylanibacillus composti]|uniref:Uncharacterized protein n=1 Tax=Xylanibacillus composti TaxID=1572762 RepID=A0A8J4H0I4_9BACL|nr:hypothetical protein [Xylanibacillus composti]MDT9726819.1 hypothetical protein [Xylanibacillus composti]GIQ67197.1 hypothetical protein XYCOK13_00210 [Xylanibacillus composti]
MSRLTDIIENHRNLDELVAILKHYGLNAEYIAALMIEQLEHQLEEGEDTDEEASQEFEESGDEEKQDEDGSQQLLDDLKQYYARF